MKTKFLTLIAVVSVALHSNAQLPEGSYVITIEEAMARTMSENPQIHALQFEEEAADLERKAAIGLRMPNISVNGAYAHMNQDMKVSLNDLKQPVQQGVTDIIGALGGMGVTVPPSLSQGLAGLMSADWAMPLQKKNTEFVGGNATLPIFLGGKINVANRAARLNQETVEVQGDVVRNSLVSELVERYYGLSLAMQVVLVREQVVQGMRVHLKDAEALEAGGMIARGERLYVEVKVAEAERELINSKLQAQTLQNALASTLNQQNDFIPSSSMFVLDGIEGVDYYKELAGDQNPILKQVELKHQLAKEGVKLEVAEYMPQVVAMGGGVFTQWQLSHIMPRWTVGVGVNIKIFDGLSREHKHAAAKRTVKQVEAIQVKATNDIGLLIEKQYNQLQGCSDNLSSIESSMNFANEYLRIKSAAFREGMGSSTDLIDAELNLAKIKTERLQAAYHYDVALARLLEAVGISGEFLDYSRRSDARAVVF